MINALLASPQHLLSSVATPDESGPAKYDSYVDMYTQLVKNIWTAINELATRKDYSEFDMVTITNK